MPNNYFKQSEPLFTKKHHLATTKHLQAKLQENTDLQRCQILWKFKINLSRTNNY